MSFLRANQDRTSGIDSVLTKTKKQAAKKEKATKKGGPDNELEVHEFGAALIRCAHAKYRGLPSIADRYQKLMEDNIKANAIFNIEDELTKAMDTLEIQQIFDKQESKLQRVFNKWCAADKTAFTEAETNTMNLDEWSMFLGKAGICLLGPDLTERAARSIFVQVNLDDELFEQSDSDNDASELVYDEFIECLLRVAIHIDRMVNKKKSIANLETLEGVDVVLDAFLTNELIPRALKKK